MFSNRTNWHLAPNDLTRVLKDVRASGQEIFDLTISNPTEAGVQIDPEVVLGALINPEATRYDPQPRGLVEARSAVCHYYREAHRVFDLSPDQLILTTSTSEAYSYVFRLLCNPADEILVPKPSYPLFEFLGRPDQYRHGLPPGRGDARQGVATARSPGEFRRVH